LRMATAERLEWVLLTLRTAVMSWPLSPSKTSRGWSR
jgi:hypothetical protein